MLSRIVALCATALVMACTRPTQQPIPNPPTVSPAPKSSNQKLLRTSPADGAVMIKKCRELVAQDAFYDAEEIVSSRLTPFPSNGSSVSVRVTGHDSLV